MLHENVSKELEPFGIGVSDGIEKSYKTDYGVLDNGIACHFNDDMWKKIETKVNEGDSKTVLQSAYEEILKKLLQNWKRLPPEDPIVANAIKKFEGDRSIARNYFITVIPKLSNDNSDQEVTQEAVFGWGPDEKPDPRNNENSVFYVKEGERLKHEAQLIQNLLNVLGLNSKSEMGLITYNKDYPLMEKIIWINKASLQKALEIFNIDALPIVSVTDKLAQTNLNN